MVLGRESDQRPIRGGYQVSIVYEGRRQPLIPADGGFVRRSACQSRGRQSRFLDVWRRSPGGRTSRKHLMYTHGRKRSVDILHGAFAQREQPGTCGYNQGPLQRPPTNCSRLPSRRLKGRLFISHSLATQAVVTADEAIQYAGGAMCVCMYVQTPSPRPRR